MSLVTSRRCVGRLAALATLAAGAVLLAGCSAGGSDVGGSGAATDAASSGTGSSSAESSGGSEDASFPRTVEHAMGSTEIPERPLRVVALDASFVDATLLLDTEVVGFTQYRAIGDDLPTYLGDDVAQFGADAVSVGTLAEPSLEQVQLLEPDLIVSAKVRHEALYDRLSAIAPTVMSQTTGPTWKDNIRLLAQALGAEELAEEEIGAYEERAAAVGTAVNAEAGSPTISVVRFLDGPTRLYQRATFSGMVLDDAGLARPPSQDVDDFALEISEESIPQADADTIFVTTAVNADGTDPATRASFLASPLWGRLTGEVVEVSDELWLTAVGVQGAHAVLDDLAEHYGVDPGR